MTGENRVIWPSPAKRPVRENGPITLEVLNDRYRWIFDFISNNSFSPTYQMMGDGWGITKAAVGRSLDLMEERGMITRFVELRVIRTNVDPYASDNDNVAQDDNSNTDL